MKIKLNDIKMIQIQRFKFKDSNSKIQIQRFKFKDSNSKIQIQRFKFKDIVYQC